MDGVGDNSPFTTALLKSVEIPGLSISDMMIRVRNETEAATLGRQVPWDQSNLREQFYFTEQQVLDPIQLSASLSRILADPVAKEKLQIELASNDLQTAVLIVGQNFAVGRRDPQPRPRQPQPAGTQVASLSRPKPRRCAAERRFRHRNADRRQRHRRERRTRRRTIWRAASRRSFAALGCYRQEVDGDWGKGSHPALTDYYRNTKQAARAPSRPWNCWAICSCAPAASASSR